MGGRIVFLGIPNKGEQNQKCSPTKGNEIRSGYLTFSGAKKRAEVLPLRSRGSPTEGDENKSGPQKGGSAMSPLRSWGSLDKGTKSKVAHKWAEVLHNPYVLGGPRKGVQKWPVPGSWKKSHSGVLKGGP